MYFSKYNIFSKVKGSENYFIVNLLSRNADILEPSIAKELMSGQWNNIAELVEKGYVCDEAEEKTHFVESYLNFIDQREKDEVQLFFVPNYSCNFACPYCYQDEYQNAAVPLNTDIIDSFFTYIQSKFHNRKKYLTLFGGEPLLDSPRQTELIAYFFQKANEASLDVCVVTNGYYLNKYIELLKTASVREVQVTLDGTEQVHNRRRFLKDNGPTFTRIVEGIDACLVARIPVNLRMVVDKENLGDIPALADFAISKKWTDNPLFKTQLGRNYELHHCQVGADKLFSRLSMYEEIFELIKEHPQILSFYRPAFSVSKFLFDQGELPEALFDSCPACKTEWAFDYTGAIYSCTATVGKNTERVGTFYPSVLHDQEKISQWEERDITAIEKCKSCNLQLACGGGCGSVAKNKNGIVASPDCRPVKELLEMGMTLYFETVDPNN
jgi:uncharacterized protein